MRTLGWTLLFCAAVSAQPMVSPPQPVYLLLCDDQGRWQAERQDRYRLPESPAAPGSLSTDWEALTNTSAFRRLAYSDRLALLSYPERLLASSWAAQFFNGRWVLVLKPVGEERMEGRLFDLVSRRESALVVSATAESGAKARSEALQLALERVEAASSPVLAGADSSLYHRLRAAHLSGQVHYETVETAARAESFGYRPCPECFAEEFERQPVYDELDYRLGQLVTAQIEAQYPVLPEGKLSERIQTVGGRLLRENRFLDQGYRFLVLDSDTVNAYVAPTGPIYVTQGLLEILDSDDELAAVLAHELSHAERRHARKQYQQSQKTSFVGLLLTYATGLPLANLGSDVSATVMTGGYSRGYELEADRDAMMVAYAAGFDPQAMSRVHDKLKALLQERGDQGVGWLQTHPGGDDREVQIREILERTADLRRLLDALQLRDPGLAVYLKGQVLFLSDDQVKLGAYLRLYERLTRAVDHSSIAAPIAPLSPAVRAILDLTSPAAASDFPGR